MNVLIITQYYPPENTLVPPAIARDLCRKGHQVRVLTGYPNYPEGELYDGYAQHWRGHEQEGGIHVLRVPLYADHSQSPIRRFLNYLSFGVSAATARSFTRGVDVIYVYATQMTPALGPWLWRLTGGAPYVLHVQDLWPDSITGSSMMSSGRAACAVDAILSPWLRSTYRHAGAVIGIAPTMVRTLVERGAPEDRTHLVYNWAAEAASPPDSGPSAMASGENTSIVYAGNVGDMQDLATAVRAAHASRDAGVRLTIVGDGVALPRVRALTEELGATNIQFLARVPRDQMGAIYHTADFALVSLKDLPTFRGTIPSKFQAAISRGVPVITTVQGDLRTLVEELGVGLTANAEDADSLAQTFRAAAAGGEQVRSQMATSAQRAYVDHFSLASGVSAVEQILRDAASGRHPDPVGKTIHPSRSKEPV